jgi:hypothetical protein
VVVVAVAKNMVPWGEVEIGEEGIAQEEAEGNRIVVGMVVAEVVWERMSGVAVGLDEHILAVVIERDTGNEAELDEGVVEADIAGWETEPAEADTGRAAEWETELVEADTGRAAEMMENIAVVVVRVRAAAHNYGVYVIADMIEEEEMFAEEERILATREHIVGEAEKAFVEGEHILATRENIVGELGTGNYSIAIVLVRDEAVALGYGVLP